MLRKLFLIATVFLLLFCVALSVSADFGDEATLGGQNADDEYRWRVTSDGDLIPGEDSATDIGEVGHEVDNIYVDDIAVTSGVTAGGDTTVTGTVTAIAYRLSTSEKVAIIDPDVDIMAGGDTTISYDYGIWVKTASGDETLTLTDGTAGDIVQIQYAIGAKGRVTITADTKTGWSTAYLSWPGNSVTFWYVDDTVGWIVLGTAGSDAGSNQITILNEVLGPGGN